MGIILVTHTAKIVAKKSTDFTHTGNYLDTRITSEHSDINKVLTNFTGIILVTHEVILSIAKNLAVSDFGDACTDLEIFRLSSR